MIVIYVKNHCPQCRMAKNLLKKYKKDYKEINVNENGEALQELRDQGYSSLPVIDFGNEIVIGFRPEEIKRCAGVIV